MSSRPVQTTIPPTRPIGGRGNARHRLAAGLYASSRNGPQTSSSCPVQAAVTGPCSEAVTAGGDRRRQAFVAGSYAAATWADLRTAPSSWRVVAAPKTIISLPVHALTAPGSGRIGAGGSPRHVPATGVAATAAGAAAARTRKRASRGLVPRPKGDEPALLLPVEGLDRLVHERQRPPQLLAQLRQRDRPVGLRRGETLELPRRRLRRVAAPLDERDLPA